MTITEKINELKKYGYKVYNFESKRMMPSGCKGFPDFVIIKHANIWFLEKKKIETKDKLSEKQKEFQKLAKMFCNVYVSYAVINEKNIDDIISMIFLMNNFYIT